MTAIDPLRADELPGPAATRPTVSVVVPHFDDLASLDLCLTALGRQTYPRDAFEIIVADNASPQGAAAVAGVIAGRARLVTVAEKGAGPARNGGVACATGEVLAFTDCDCKPQPGWLAAGVEALARFDVVGGRMVVLVDDPRRMTATEAFESVFAFNNRRYVTRLNFTVTANLFCRRALFEDVGGFRVGISEDIEWSRRAIQAGYRLGYGPDAVVGHPARKTWLDLLKKWRRTNREIYSLYSSRKGGTVEYITRSCLMPLSAIFHTPRVLTSRNISGARQRAGAICVLYRIRIWRFVDALRLVFDPDKSTLKF
jgi:GT2 family glycosyltransferase